jgi:hypothetical protein
VRGIRRGRCLYTKAEEEARVGVGPEAFERRGCHGSSRHKVVVVEGVGPAREAFQKVSTRLWQSLFCP